MIHLEPSGKEALENRIGDRVEIKIVGSMGQAVAVPEAVTSVGKGVFDLVYTPLAYHTGVIPELTIYTVLRPWAWRDCYKMPKLCSIGACVKAR